MTFDYASFCRTVAGLEPFPYQIELGTKPWPVLLDVPTGLGKTLAVVVGWLYKRLTSDANTGRRLIYCLPMRTLVEQTADEAQRWCQRAAPLFVDAGLTSPTVHTLLGGDVDREWAERPEDPMILVGTQDLLLSRALNRGYAASRYRWPMHFGLVSSDCLWVFDETQLLGVGVETSAQLQAFRERLGVVGSAHTLWMSATLGESQMATVDHPRPEAGWPTVRLSDAEHQQPDVRARVEAPKTVARMNGLTIGPTNAREGVSDQLAPAIVDLHERRGGLTLVVLNRVSRAQALFAHLQGLVSQSTSLALVHSRFRTQDRKGHTTVLTGTGDRIVVATQAVEAGVDVSARTLVTELAPWPSLIQRFGRCNRYGRPEDADAVIRWIDLDTDDPKTGSQAALPNTTDDLATARELLTALMDNGGHASPTSLREIPYEPPPIVRPVIRRRDILDLFDTTPDITGNDVDVSRYVRDGNDTDVQVYWREFGGESPAKDLPPPSRDELCRVSIGAAKAFFEALRKKRKTLAGRGGRDRQTARLLKAWAWDRLDRRWNAIESVRPGQVVLFHAAVGGYTAEAGWNGTVLAGGPVPVVDLETDSVDPLDAHDSDPTTTAGGWVLLTDHLQHVGDEAELLAERLGLEAGTRDVLRIAGTWHDVGKAHEDFVARLLRPLDERPDERPSGDGPWAKSPHRYRAKDVRKHFRHELASALTWLAAGDAVDDRVRDLVAYLVAAHHGKVRASIRSVPGEKPPPNGNGGRLFARGVWDGDVLRSVTLPNERRLDGVRLDLSIMTLGVGSWHERVLALRDAQDLGPFRLAFLEAVIVAADWRASRREQEEPS